MEGLQGQRVRVISQSCRASLQSGVPVSLSSTPSGLRSPAPVLRLQELGLPPRKSEVFPVFRPCSHPQVDTLCLTGGHWPGTPSVDLRIDTSLGCNHLVIITAEV